MAESSLTNLFLDLENKIKTANIAMKAITNSPNPYVTREALSQFVSAKAKNAGNSISTKVKKEMEDSYKIEQKIDYGFFKEEAEARAKLYNAYRSVLRFFPELANAIRMTGEHIANAEGVTAIPSYGVGMKINTTKTAGETIDETETDQEKKMLTEFLERFEFDKKVFAKAVDLVREGDYFVEVINLNKITVSARAKENGFELITENASKVLEESLTKLAGAEFDKAIFVKDKIKPIVESFLTKPDTTLKRIFLEEETSLLVELHKEQYKITEASLTEKDGIDNKNSLNTSVSSDELNRVIFRRHKPENVCILSLNGEIFGYVIVSSEKVAEKADELEGMFSNYKDKNRETNRNAQFRLRKEFNDKLTSIIVDSIKVSDNDAINKIIASNSEVKQLIYNNVVDSKASAVRFVSKEMMVHYKVAAVVEIDKTYGESSMYSMLPDIKDYIRLKKTLTNYLLARSVEKERVTVMVDVDGDAESAINEVIMAFKNREAALENTLADVDSVGKPMSIFDRMFLPKINGETPIEIETVAQAAINIDRETLKQFRNEIIAGIRTPSSLMDSTENSYHTTAAQESMSYAMTILELQKIITDGDTELVTKALTSLGKLIPKYFRYTLAPPSSLMNEVLENNVSRARTIIDFIYEMYVDESVDNRTVAMSRSEIAKRIIPAFDWEAFDKICEDSTTQYLKDKNTITKGGSESGLL